MAKDNEKFKSDDDFDLDSDLDFDNLDLDAAMGSDEDNRISVMGLGKSIMSDVAGRISDPRRASELAAHFLPNELSSNVSDSLDAFDDAKDLIDKSVDQAKPIISDLASTVNKLLPESWKGTREFFNKFIQEKTINQKKDPRKAEDERIAATLNDIFGQQMAQQESIRQEEKAEAAVKEKISQDQHKAEYKTLSNINLNIQKLTDYNSKINALYQRKSLEIQLRSFNMQANIYDLLKQYTAKTTGLFDAIMHNTALPDFVKVTKSEMFKKAFLDKTIDKTIGIVGQRGFGKFAKSVIGSLKSQLASGVSNLGQFGMLSMVGDMIDPSMGMTKEKMAMDAGAGFIIGQLSSLMGDKFKESDMGKMFTSKATRFAGRMESVPSMLKGWVSSLNNYANNVKKSTGVKGIKEDGSALTWQEAEQEKLDAERFKKLGWFDKTTSIFKYGAAKGLAKILGKGMNDSGIDGSNVLDLGKDDAKTLNEVAQFTRGAEKSITKVIPGYLARILQQVTISASGNPKVPLLIFDHSTGRFRKDSSIKEDFFKNINKDADRDRGRYIREMNEIKQDLFGKKRTDKDFKEGDKERTFTDEQEKAMDQLLDKFVLNSSYTLHNAESFKKDFVDDIVKSGKFTEDEAKAIVAQMTSLQGDDKATIDKLNSIGDKIRGVRGGVTFDKTKVKQLIEENPESLNWLLSSGLVEYKNGRYEVNEDKFYQQRRYGGVDVNGNIIPPKDKNSTTSSTALLSPGADVASTELAPPGTSITDKASGNKQSSNMQVPKTLLGVNTSMLETLNSIRDMMANGLKVRGGVSGSIGDAFNRFGDSISSGVDTLKNFAGTGKEKFFTMIEFIKAKKNEYFSLDPKGKIIKALAKKLKMTPEQLLDSTEGYIEHLKNNVQMKFDDMKGLFGEFKGKFISGAKDKFNQAKDKVGGAFNGLMNKAKNIGLLSEGYNSEEGGFFGSMKNMAGNMYDTARDKVGEYKDKASEYYEKAKNYTKEKCITEVKNYFSTVKNKFEEGKNKLKELYNKAKETVNKDKAKQKVEQVESWYKSQLELLQKKYDSTKEILEGKIKEISSTNDEGFLFKIASTCYDTASSFLGKAFTFGGDSAKWVFDLAKSATGSIASGVGSVVDTVSGKNNAVDKDGNIDESKLTEEQKDALALQRLREAEGNEYSNAFIETPQRLLKLALKGGRGFGSLSLGAGKLASWLAPKVGNVGMGAAKFLTSGGLGLGGALSVLGNSGEFAAKMAGKVGGKLLSTALRFTDDYKELEKCMDLYLASDPKTPVILARDMKAGYYIDMESGKPITMIGDIRGNVGRLPVPASEVNGEVDVTTVLTMDDIRRGVVNSKGKDMSRFLLENKARGKSKIRKSFLGSLFGRAVGSDVGEQGKGGKTNEAPIDDTKELSKRLALNYIWFKGKDEAAKKKTAEQAMNDCYKLAEKNGVLYPSDLKKILKKYLKSNTDVILDAGGSLINGGFKIVNKHLDEHSIFGKTSALFSNILGANRGGFSTEMDDKMSVDDALEHFPKTTEPFKGKNDEERKKNAKKAADAIQTAAKGGKLTPRVYKKIMEKYTVPISDKAFNMLGGAGRKIADVLDNEILDGKLFGARSFFGNLRRGLGIKGAFNLARSERQGNNTQEDKASSTEGMLVGGDGKTKSSKGTTAITEPVHMFSNLLGKAGGLFGKAKGMFAKALPGVGIASAAASVLSGDDKKAETTAEKNEERAKKKEEEKEKEKQEAIEAAKEKEADSSMGGILGDVWDKVKKFGIMGIIGVVGAVAWKFKDQIIAVGKGLWKGVKWIWKNAITPLWKGIKWTWSKVLKPLGEGIWNVGKKIVGVFSWVGKTISKIIGGIWGALRDNPISNFLFGDRKDDEDKGFIGNTISTVSNALSSQKAHNLKRKAGKATSWVLNNLTIVGGFKQVGKLMTSNRTKLRMLQYGFAASADSNYSAVQDLENYIIDEKCITEGKGGILNIDLGRIPTEDLNDIFDLQDKDENYNQRTEIINQWLQKRFAPVFVTNINNIRRIFGDVDLDHITDAKDSEFYRYLKSIKHVQGLDWSFRTDPFSMEPKELEDTKGLFENLWNKLVNELPEQIRKKEDKGDGNSEPVADAKVPGQVKVNNDGTVIIETESTDKDKITGTSGKIIKNYKKPTALECIRFKCYGITEIEPKYVTIMRLVEEGVEDKLVENSGQMTLTIGLEELLGKVGPLFELSSNETKTDKGKVFEAWFKNRFLVVYLKYIGKVFNKYKEKKREKIEQRLQDIKFIIELARELVKLPVWEVKSSPWMDKYELNDDPSTTTRNLNYLEQRVRSSLTTQDVGLDKATQVSNANKPVTANSTQVTTENKEQTGQTVAGSSQPANGQDGNTAQFSSQSIATAGGGSAPTGKGSNVNLTHLGSVSAKYESGSRGAGTISSGKGDHGGKSYGIYQLAIKTGTLQKFIKMSGFAHHFNGLTPGSEEFDAKWKELASTPAFADAQHNFIRITHYAPAVSKLRQAGFDVSKKGRAVHELIYSTAVQYGPARVAKFFTEAFQGKDFNSMSDADIVSTLQDYKYKNVDVHFGSSSQAVRDSIRKNRIPNEKADLLKIAGGGGSASMPSNSGNDKPDEPNINGTKAIDPTISNPAKPVTSADIKEANNQASDQIGKTGVAMTKDNVNAIFDKSKVDGPGTEKPAGDAEAGKGDTGSSGGKTSSPTGAKANDAINKYINIMQENAKGSTYSQANRMGNKYYDCSSFVSRSLKDAGFNVNPSNNCGTLKADLEKNGFKWHGGSFGKDLSKLQPGDILLKSQPQGHRHTETYLGDGQIIGARTSSKPYPLGIGPRNFWDDKYEGFLRLEGANNVSSPSNQQGSATSDAPVKDSNMDSPSNCVGPDCSGPSNGGSVSQTPTASSNSGSAPVAQSASASNYERDKPSNNPTKETEVKTPKDQTAEKMLKVQEDILNVLKEISKGNVTDAIKDNVSKVIEAIKEVNKPTEDPSKIQAEQAAKKNREEDKEGYNSSPYTPKSIMNLGKTHFY